jgi:hypothetical protein
MRQIRMAIALGSALLGASTVLAAGGRPAPLVRTASILGRTLVVGIMNPSPLPFHGIVTTRVRTSRGVATLITILDIAGGSTATLKTDVPKDASDQPPLSVVVDDGVPF